MTLSWQEWKKIPIDTKDLKKGYVDVLITRKEKMIAFPIKSLNIGIMISAAEDKNHSPIDLPLDLVIKVANVEKMIFSNVNSYQQLTSIVETLVTQIIKEESFYSIGDEKIDERNHRIISDRLSMEICGLNISIPSRPDKMGLIDVLGIKIESAQMRSPAIVGEGAEELIRATQVVFIATENAKAKVEDAKGISDSDVIIAQGQRKARIEKAQGEKDAMIIEGECYTNIKHRRK